MNIQWIFYKTESHLFSGKKRVLYKPCKLSCWFVLFRFSLVLVQANFIYFLKGGKGRERVSATGIVIFVSSDISMVMVLNIWIHISFITLAMKS